MTTNQIEHVVLVEVLGNGVFRCMDKDFGNREDVKKHLAEIHKKDPIQRVNCISYNGRSREDIATLRQYFNRDYQTQTI